MNMRRLSGTCRKGYFYEKMVPFMVFLTIEVTGYMLQVYLSWSIQHIEEIWIQKRGSYQPSLFTVQYSTPMKKIQRSLGWILRSYRKSAESKPNSNNKTYYLPGDNYMCTEKSIFLCHFIPNQSWFGFFL